MKFGMRKHTGHLITESGSGNLDRGISSCPDQLEIASKEASKQIIRGGLEWLSEIT
ncbi:hypothetical protein J2S00_002767 [Caldalkalibacillus uzonensis]|uniref:Uncharacterized protein n=1 Tax=Caldalkalibacillus uzonensis TaxID=353224 RepID=A0ABU0CV19_9BACI|nr:hypothetical protein [Caldalkalibacillus uzonensis]